jgi:tyrosyl-tRNA synthetase
MGKTQKGAVWLDPEKTTPYEFFQYWRNVADADVIKCLKLLTFLPVEEIEKMAEWEGSRLNEAKEILAYELTNLVHGEEEAKKALEAARAIFGGTANADMPTTSVAEGELVDGKISVIDLLVKAKMAPSKGEAKRLVMQGGVTLNDTKVEKFDETVSIEDLKNGAVIKKGKKIFRKFILE